MIVRPILQSIVEDIDFDDLPTNWNVLDTESFSKSKKLWDFQQEALKNAIKVLYFYFKEDQADKKKFYQRYRLNGLDEDLERGLDIKLSKVKRKVLSILQQYYPIEDDRIKFYNFINRSAFWMATGSGKTLLIVKLVEVLKRLCKAYVTTMKHVVEVYEDTKITYCFTNILRRYIVYSFCINNDCRNDILTITSNRTCVIKKLKFTKIGTYIISVKWSGDENHLPCSSKTYILVKPIPVKVYVFVSNRSLPTMGGVLEISIKVRPRKFVGLTNSFGFMLSVCSLIES